MLGLGLRTTQTIKSSIPMPLDIYKNNLVMGFSYYKLLSSYNGYCVKVRRSSDNLTQDFGFVRKKYVNLATNANITASFEQLDGINYIIDNDLSAGFSPTYLNAQWIKFDLGEIYNISNINIWRYTGRIYHDIIIQISTDNVNWVTLFNNDSDNSAGQGMGADAEYIETLAGKKLTPNQNAKYVRFWSNGNHVNTYNHYMEVEILTTVNEWYIDIDSILAFCGSGNGFVHTWYNQYTGGNNAVQINNGYQPQIISNGLFSYDGLKFTTAANTALRIIKYSSMNIVDEPASFYLNGLINNTIGSQWFLAVNTSLATDIQFGLLRTNEYLRFVKGSYDTIITNEAKTQGSTFKNLWVWENKNVNGFSSQPSGTLGTINTQLTSRDNVYIGARSASADGNTSAGSLDGKIKTLVVLNSLSDYNLMSNY